MPPVITLVIYWGAGEWDGPMSLHEMMDTKDADILRYIPDYRINLIAAQQMSDAEVSCFPTKNSMHQRSDESVTKKNGKPSAGIESPAEGLLFFQDIPYSASASVN